MNSDTELRRQPPPSSMVKRGEGLSISMLCAKCNRPKPQLGSKKRRLRGAIVAVCRECVEAGR